MTKDKKPANHKADSCAEQSDEESNLVMALKMALLIGK